MKILIVGGAGHVGTHLTSMLVKEGHDVAIGGRTDRIKTNSLLEGARFVFCDSTDDALLAELAQAEKFDVVVDFPGTAWNVWNAFKDISSHIIACGSFWMYGKPRMVPTPERFFENCFFDGYVKRYEKIVQILEEEKEHKASFTAIMPPNICGPGKIPLDTLGGRDIEVHKANMRGDMVYLPEGPEALITPCDAWDLANAFALAIAQPEKAAGQIFNIGTDYPITSTRLVEIFEEIHGVNIPITYVPWNEYIEKYNTQQGGWWHFYAHMFPDTTKARALLGYRPKYTPEETLQRAVEWMKEQQLL